MTMEAFYWNIWGTGVRTSFMKNNTTIQGALDPSKYVINLIRVSIN